MSHRAPTVPEPSPTSCRRTAPSPKAPSGPPLCKRSETGRHATTSHDTQRNRTIYDQHKASTQKFLMPPPPTVCVRPPKRTSEAADCAKPLPPRHRTVPPPHTSSRPPPADPETGRHTMPPHEIRRTQAGGYETLRSATPRRQSTSDRPSERSAPPNSSRKISRTFPPNRQNERPAQPDSPVAGPCLRGTRLPVPCAKRPCPAAVKRNDDGRPVTGTRRGTFPEGKHIFVSAAGTSLPGTNFLEKCRPAGCRHSCRQPRPAPSAGRHPGVPESQILGLRVTA